MVLEKTLETLLDCKEIKPVHPKGNQSWIHWNDWCWSLNSNTWTPDAENWVIGKVPDAGKHWRQEEKGMREDEMVGWHHWLDGHEFEKASRFGDVQRGLAYCSPWGRKKSDRTERLNWYWYLFLLHSENSCYYSTWKQ